MPNLPDWCYEREATVVKTKTTGEAYQYLRWGFRPNGSPIWRISAVFTDRGLINVSKFARPEFGAYIPRLYRAGTLLTFVMQRAPQKDYARFWLPTDKYGVEYPPENLVYLPEWLMKYPEPDMDVLEHVEPDDYDFARMMGWI